MGRVLTVGLATWLLCLSPAYAQTPINEQARVKDEALSKEEAAVQEARRLFVEAKEQLTIGNAVLGRDLLRRSLALRSRVPTRYNLGIALRRTGETTEAIAVFEGLLVEPTLLEEEKERIDEQLERARAELARLSVLISGAEAAKIEIDGLEVGEAQSGAPLLLPVDAGEHVVTARAGGTAQQTVEVGPGKTHALKLHVLSITERDQVERKRKRTRRAAWITAGVVIVAGIVATSVVLTRRGNETPPDPIPGGDGVLETLRQSK